jgi:hypothetical protein
MKALLIAVVLLQVGIAGLEFYRGWFQFSTNSADHKPSATITVDQDKIQADENKAKERMHDLRQKAGDRTSDRTEKVK